MDGFLLPLIGIAAVVIAAVVLTKLFAQKPESAPAKPANRSSHASAAAAQPRPAPSASAEKSFPITTIGIPPGHVTPSSGTAAGRSYPITTVGIPPGHVTRA